MRSVVAGWPKINVLCLSFVVPNNTVRFYLEVKFYGPLNLSVRKATVWHKSENDTELNSGRLVRQKQESWRDVQEITIETISSSSFFQYADAVSALYDTVVNEFLFSTVAKLLQLLCASDRRGHV